MYEKGEFGTFKCECGQDVLITYEVVPVGLGVQTVFKGICKCGKKASSWFPEKVRDQLLEKKCK